MAIDQRDITSQLRMMGDPELRQYAAMHKNDPYIFPLAFQESQNRQKVRMSGQAQMGGQEMPKVNDAALMAMAPQAAPQQAPQAQGISNLPAPNMQRMADGGIAGYGDDEESMADGGMTNYDDAGMATGGMGGMFDFAQRSEPVVRMSGGGVARYNGATGSVTGVAPELLSKYQQEATEMAMGTRMQFSPDVKAVVGRIQAAQESSYLKEEQKQMLEGNPLRNKTQDSASMVAPTAPTASAAYDPTENLKKLAQTNARYTTPSEPKNAEEAAMLNRYPAPKPAPAPAKKTKAKIEAPAPTPDTLASLGIVPYGQSKVGAAPAAPAYTPKSAEKIRAASDKLAEPELAEIQKSYKPFAEQFAQDRSRIEGREKNAVSDALIRAGLATMAGKSQFALQNIGEGGLQGLNAYQEGQKANEASRRALTQSEMLMSQAQRAESRGARADAVSLYAQAEKAEQVGLQFQQKAQEITNTKEYQQGVLQHYERADKSGALTAQAQMLSAQNRGLGAASADDRRMATLVKVQNALNTNPEYKEAAKFANLSGKIGDNARATIKRLQEEVYNSIAPEMLQSRQSSPSGSGGGQNIIDFTKIP